MCLCVFTCLSKFAFLETVDPHISQECGFFPVYFHMVHKTWLPWKCRFTNFTRTFSSMCLHMLYQMWQIQNNRFHRNSFSIVHVCMQFTKCDWNENANPQTFRRISILRASHLLSMSDTVSKLIFVVIYDLTNPFYATTTFISYRNVSITENRSIFNII